MDYASIWSTCWSLGRAAAVVIGYVLWHVLVSETTGEELTLAGLFHKVPLALGFVGAWDMAPFIALWYRTRYRQEPVAADTYQQAWATARDGLWPIVIGFSLALVGWLLNS